MLGLVGHVCAMAIVALALIPSGVLAAQSADAAKKVAISRQAMPSALLPSRSQWRPLELTRDRRGHYLLGDLGSRQARGRFGPLIEASGERWRLRRKLFGFGQAITAVNASDGSLSASYVPRGFLHLRGIYGGELRLSTTGPGLAHQPPVGPDLHRL